MADKSNQPIIKRVKKAGHGHHGGAWKVAYADFVTAMMAFFLLLWLLNSVTQEQLEGISNYFAPASVAPTSSGAGGMLAGQTIAEEGVEQNRRSKPSVSLALPPPRLGEGGDSAAGQQTETPPEDLSEREADELLARKEQEQFEQAEEALRQAIQSVPSLSQLAKSLLIDNTPEGLRVQIVDQEGLAMFPRGSAEMFLHTRRVLELVSRVINEMPQQVAITGHTDATPFVSDQGYGNWELSADRANAARRALIDMGVPPDRIARVVGKADREPLLSDDPANPRNRRLSIVLLRHTGEQSAEALNPPTVEVPATPAASGLPSEPAGVPAPAPAQTQ